jgi:hypothetical protein
LGYVVEDVVGAGNPCCPPFIPENDCCPAFIPPFENIGLAVPYLDDMAPALPVAGYAAPLYAGPAVGGATVCVAPPQLPPEQPEFLQPTTADRRIAPVKHKKRLDFLILVILSV